jgi:hypothetical protein
MESKNEGYETGASCAPGPSMGIQYDKNNMRGIKTDFLEMVKKR